MVVTEAVVAGQAKVTGERQTHEAETSTSLMELTETTTEARMVSMTRGLSIRKTTTYRNWKTTKDRRQGQDPRRQRTRRQIWVRDSATKKESYSAARIKIQLISQATPCLGRQAVQIKLEEVGNVQW
jgi:hypothetical protein